MNDNNKRDIIILTVVLTIVEYAVGNILFKHNIINTSSWIIVFLSYATPVGFLCFINYYLLSPIIWHLLVKIWCLLGHYNRVSYKFNNLAGQCVAWLNSLKFHWGVIDSSDECQNANTCEGLLAMKKTKLDVRYKILYEDALNDIMSNITYNGLASKSLKHETVVCTSMMLYIYALESKTNTKMQQYRHIINAVVINLWNAHCNKGWAVFVEKPKDDTYFIANTFWAFRALNEYPISQSGEFKNMLRRVYECANDSLFGFVIGDSPRLCTTAMSVILYYNLNEKSKNYIKEIYDVKKAVNFVYKMFCYKGLECELEILNGVDSKSSGAKKAPWTHVTISFASEALIGAYRYGELSLLKMNNYIRCMEKICKKRLVYINGNDQCCYYVPKNMEINNAGIFTFPTAYMAWALSEINLIKGGK